MQIELKFLGAAKNVTGSSYLLKANGTSLLVDCGLYQEREFRARNWEAFPVEPASIDAVLLTHAHLDHCGLLPKLAREGFTGKIYCTPATSDIAKIIWLDSAHIQEEDAEFKRQRHQREGRKGKYPEIPLYTTEDAEACLGLRHPVPYEEVLKIGQGIEVSFHDAGHVLGASMIKVKVSQNGQTRTILFSGDVGRWDRPILRDPTIFHQAEYVLVESTYGDRLHGGADSIKDDLAQAINSAQKSGGNIIVPSFALERSQEVLYYLNELLLAKRISHLKVFVDSPMAINLTEIFRNHAELFDQEMTELLRRNNSPFDFPGLEMTRTTDQSKAINHIKGTVLVIAGSGMCTGGRVKHHLVQNISRPESIVLFVGYQASGTLGRQILEKPKEVRILGRMHRLKAKISRITGFSAHADRDELLRWLNGLEQAPKQVFVVHGEEYSADEFARHLRQEKGWQVSVPEYLQTVRLD